MGNNDWRLEKVRAWMSHNRGVFRLEIDKQGVPRCLGGYSQPMKSELV
jgi:hypothetical protein